MNLKKIIPTILYLFVMPSALSGETSDLVTGTITVKDSFVDSRIMKFPATVETYDKKQIEETVNAAKFFLEYESPILQSYFRSSHPPQAPPTI